VGISPVVTLVVALACAFAVTLMASMALTHPVVGGVRATPQVPVVVETAAYPAWSVATGDTLWTIAQRTRPQADPRAVVLQIQVLNGISTDHVLQAGDVLQLPVE
jgi:Tfp pilus assembly protein FimV